MAGAITRTPGQTLQNITKSKITSSQKGYSSNLPRYREDPIGYTGTVVQKDNNSKNTGGNGGGGSVATTATNDGSSALLAYLRELEARQQRAANEAYNRNVAAMNNAFSERGKLMENNLNTTLQNLQTDYDASKANVNKDAQNSLQQAYINNMMSRKNLNQNMAAQGLSGGASETTMAGMYNNYGNARNNIQTVANDNLGELENLYNKNKNSAYQAYNDQLAQDAITKAQYMAQFESDRQNALANAYNQQMSQLMSLDPTYLTGMLGLVDAQQSYSPVATQADNTPGDVTTSQGDAIMGSYYGRLARSMKGKGQSDEEISRELYSSGVPTQTILHIINQLQ